MHAPGPAVGPPVCLSEPVPLPDEGAVLGGPSHGRSGLAILYKRLEVGTFQLPRAPEGSAQAEIGPAELALILEGIDLDSVKRRARYQRPTASPIENGI